MNSHELELIELNELVKLNKNQIERTIKTGYKENLILEYNVYKLQNKILYNETFNLFITVLLIDYKFKFNLITLNEVKGVNEYLINEYLKLFTKFSFSDIHEEGRIKHYINIIYETNIYLNNVFNKLKRMEQKESIIFEYENDEEFLIFDELNQVLNLNYLIMFNNCLYLEDIDEETFKTVFDYIKLYGLLNDINLNMVFNVFFMSRTQFYKKLIELDLIKFKVKNLTLCQKLNLVELFELNERARLIKVDEKFNLNIINYIYKLKQIKEMGISLSDLKELGGFPRSLRNSNLSKNNKIKVKLNFASVEYLEEYIYNLKENFEINKPLLNRTKFNLTLLIGRTERNKNKVAKILQNKHLFNKNDNNEQLFKFIDNFKRNNKTKNKRAFNGLKMVCDVLKLIDITKKLSRKELLTNKLLVYGLIYIINYLYTHLNETEFNKINNYFKKCFTRKTASPVLVSFVHCVFMEISLFDYYSFEYKKELKTLCYINNYNKHDKIFKL